MLQSLIARCCSALRHRQGTRRKRRTVNVWHHQQHQRRGEQRDTRRQHRRRYILERKLFQLASRKFSFSLVSINLFLLVVYAVGVKMFTGVALCLKWGSRWGGFNSNSKINLAPPPTMVEIVLPGMMSSRDHYDRHPYHIRLIGSPLHDVYNGAVRSWIQNRPRTQ